MFVITLLSFYKATRVASVYFCFLHCTSGTYIVEGKFHCRTGGVEVTDGYIWTSEKKIPSKKRESRVEK
jgi:hypothetical protein